MPDPTIFVDADACPVKDEAMRVAERLGLVITYVSNGGVRPSRDPMVRNMGSRRAPTPPTTGSWSRRRPMTSC